MVCLLSHELCFGVLFPCLQGIERTTVILGLTCLSFIKTNLSYY